MLHLLISCNYMFPFHDSMGRTKSDTSCELQNSAWSLLSRILSPSPLCHLLGSHKGMPLWSQMVATVLGIRSNIWTIEKMNYLSYCFILGISKLIRSPTFNFLSCLISQDFVLFCNFKPFTHGALVYLSDLNSQFGMIWMFESQSFWLIQS